MTIPKWPLALALATAALATALHWHQLDESARLAAAQASLDGAAHAERQRDPLAALELYENAISQRTGTYGLYLPWGQDWSVLTRAHIRAAGLLQNLDDGSGSLRQQRQRAVATRAHAEAVLEAKPDHPLANGVLADSLARYGDYPAALPFLARLDRLAGRGAPYVDARGRPNFPLPTNAASVLPASASVAFELEADLGPAGWSALVNFDSWLRRHGARISPKLRLSADVLGDGTGLRGLIATEAIVHRELLLQIPLRCTLTAHSPHLDRRRRRHRAHQQLQQRQPSQQHVLIELMEAHPELVAVTRPTQLQIDRGHPSQENVLLILRLLFEARRLLVTCVICLEPAQC